MPSWYDIVHLDPVEPIEDRKGFESSSIAIASLIESLSKRFPFKQLVVGGFSQGGAVSLYASLKNHIKPTALIILSSYLPFAKSDFAPSNTSTNTSLYSRHADVPVFWGHGTADPLIPIQWARFSSNRTSCFFKSVIFKEYKGMYHSVSLDEERDVMAFLDSYGN